VRVVASLLALEIARTAGGPARTILGPEALLSSPGLDERAIDREVLIREQRCLAGLAEHRVEEGLRDLAAQEPLAVLGEHGDVPDRVVGVQSDEPAEEQVVVEALHQEALAAHRVQQLEQERPQQLLRRDRGPARLRVEAVEERIELGEGPLGHCPDRPQRMVRRHTLLGGPVAPHCAGLWIVTTHLAPPRVEVALPYQLLRMTDARGSLTARFSAAS